MKPQKNYVYWFKKLRPDLRKKAIKAVKVRGFRPLYPKWNKYSKFSECLESAFFWDKTKEGHGFWSKIYKESLAQEAKEEKHG